MRGGGNIIGSEQSGHIREVGVELYYKMINETINEIKNLDVSETDWSPTIKLGFSFNIPEDGIVFEAGMTVSAIANLVGATLLIDK